MKQGFEGWGWERVTWEDSERGSVLGTGCHSGTPGSRAGSLGQDQARRLGWDHLRTGFAVSPRDVPTGAKDAPASQCLAGEESAALRYRLVLATSEGKNLPVISIKWEVFLKMPWRPYYRFGSTFLQILLQSLAGLPYRRIKSSLSLRLQKDWSCFPGQPSPIPAGEGGWQGLNHSLDALGPRPRTHICRVNLAGSHQPAPTSPVETQPGGERCSLSKTGSNIYYFC